MRAPASELTIDELLNPPHQDVSTTVRFELECQFPITLECIASLNELYKGCVLKSGTRFE